MSSMASSTADTTTPVVLYSWDEEVTKMRDSSSSPCANRRSDISKLAKIRTLTLCIDVYLVYNSSQCSLLVFGRLDTPTETNAGDHQHFYGSTIRTHK